MGKEGRWVSVYIGLVSVTTCMAMMNRIYDSCGLLSDD